MDEPKPPPDLAQLVELTAGLVSLVHGRQTAMIAVLQAMLRPVSADSALAHEIRLQLERTYASQLASATNPPAIAAFEQTRDALLLALGRAG